MAKQYYGINRGQVQTDISSGTSDPSADLEIVYDLTKNLTRAEILQLLKLMENRIIEDKFPPN